ncbi:hypothetical protein [Microbacterium oxydans]|uniref:hypothetical protein n=1 Tax=Microbacterium oxydans TaxID=82380 RepID=UPI00226B1D7A|nr:hypothetical protein [Microbacterium oxydans]WAA65911.1 hypothetical protein MME74_17015 [Microbacterium oxydans]
MQFAFIDESEPLGAGNGGPYVMVATLPLCDDAEQLDDLRRTLYAMKPRRAAKLHWYDSVGSLRDDTVDVIGAMPLMHWAVVVRPSPGDRSERTRRACIARILWELDGLDVVSHVVFESRGAADDLRDMNMVQALRASRRLSSRMRVDHVRGADEPLLWLPDAVCGAVNGRIMGSDVWSGRLDHQLWIVEENAKPGPHKQQEIPGSLLRPPRRGSYL